MWRRTKRIINAYLDGLIEKVSSPARETRDVTRGEIGRLNAVEATSLGEAKRFEKELAEVDLKILGAAEREKMFRGRGDEANANRVLGQIATLSAQRDLLKQQVQEAKGYAARARALREERKRLGEELATQTEVTAMQDAIAKLQAPLDASGPAATIDEMRQRLERTSGGALDAQVAGADRELEEAAQRARVDELLSRYKGTVEQGPAEKAAPAKPEPQSEDKEKEGAKTLGPSNGPIRPID